LLYKTKINPGARPQEVDFPRLEGEEACPATAISNFLNLRESMDPKMPLFDDKSGQAIRPDKLNDKIKDLMATIETDFERTLHV
jgi:hypothetical protein